MGKLQTELKRHVAPNKRMQSDKLLRYAPQFAADAGRYVAG